MPKTRRRAFFQKNSTSKATQDVLEQTKKVYEVDCNFVTQVYFTYETNYDSKSLKSESFKSESLESGSFKIRKQDYDFFQSNTDCR